MSNLTIAQALRRTKKTRGNISELKTRASEAVSHEAGKKPTFDFEPTCEALANAKEELIKLESSIACANASTTITYEGKSMTLAEAIRRLQELKDQMSWLTSLHIREGVERSSDLVWNDETGRQSRVTTEVTYITKLSERDRVEKIESLRDQFEALNDLVEQANHRTEVKVAV